MQTTGATRFVLGIAELTLGQRGEEHFHENTEEAMYVFAGKGLINIEGEGDYEVSEGNEIFIPSGKKHRVGNQGKTTFKVVWVYSPPGAETRWKTGAKI